MLKPEDIYSALGPLYYFTKLLGFSPFQLKGKSSVFLSVVNILWCMTLIAVFGMYAFYELNTAPTDDTIVVEIAESISTNLSILSLCGSILFACISRNNIANVIRGIAIIDEELRTLHLDVDTKVHYRNTKSYSILSISVLLIYMGGIIFVSCIDHLMNHNVVTLGLVIAHSAPLFSVFAELQFCGFALLLRKRFCWINMKMEDLVNKQSQRNRPVSKRSALAQKNIILTLLQKIGDKHHELCTITKQLNKAYAVQMLLFMIQAFLIIIIMSFYLIKMYLLNSFQEITPNEKIVYINTLTFQISLVFIIVLICSSTSKEARKAGILLHNLVSLNSVNGVESFDIEVACFSLQLLHHNVKFTACRLFVVDETLLYTIFGAATTYLVIVLQFEFGISTASNAANELKSAAQTIKPQLPYKFLEEVLARLAELEQRLIEEIRMIKESEPKLKSLQIPVSTNKPKLAEKSHVGYSRDLEAVQNNQTIHMTELGKSFLHFWKVYDIVNILNYSESSIDSAMFYVQGNPLIITIHPRHLGTQYLALELSSSSWVPAHRFVILNQNNPKGDLSSQILGTKIPLFRIHADRISTSDFITDGSLIIKAIISYY
ncbi:hypothetical protein PPYR_05073 [Photinus pyralis]|uniref:Gustatory receptor n=2 Tax=Photinus pyralis TaxID=7054 RepID=A0A5N4AZV9_PHOPY|nr:hypothetical protein PPYR_05073 [Photinus pyralis]